MTSLESGLESLVQIHVQSCFLQILYRAELAAMVSDIFINPLVHVCVAPQNSKPTMQAKMCRLKHA